MPTRQLYLRATLPELYITFTPASTAMATPSCPTRACYKLPSSLLWQPQRPLPVIHAMAQLILTSIPGLSDVCSQMP
jgi:hypothetical protein